MRLPHPQTTGRYLYRRTGIVTTSPPRTMSLYPSLHSRYRCRLWSQPRKHCLALRRRVSDGNTRGSDY
ncbi:hypothetical protein OH492_20490 [Vibrio chagasii]|nr:hypothetical protein [Vibrio chagasii]